MGNCVDCGGDDGTLGRGLGQCIDCAHREEVAAAYRAGLEEMREERDRLIEGLRVLIADERAGSWARMYGKRTLAAVRALQEDRARIGQKLTEGE